MAVFLADPNTIKLMEEVRNAYHPHLLEARIVVMFFDKRRVNGEHIVLGVAKKISEEDKILCHFDFKIILSAMDWGELEDIERRALLDHELSHCGVEYEPIMEKVGGKDVPVKDQYGRIIPSDKIKRDDEGNPKWKLIPHDFENFYSIAERYGLEVSSLIGGYFPMSKPESSSDSN